jgi:hypothetical protein
MKKQIIGLILILIAFGIQTNAQEKDTTRIKFGKKEIIIIERDGDKTEVKIKTPEGESNLDSLDFLKNEIPDSIEVSENERDDSKSKFKGHWSGFDIGINNYFDANNKLIGSENSMALDAGKSWCFGVNLLQYDLPIIKENFGIVTGIGFTWNNYRFSGKQVLAKNQDGIIEMDNPDFVDASSEGFDFQRNKLGTCFIDVPLLLEFQAPVTHSGKKIFFNAGVTAGIKLASWTHQEWEIGKTEYERHDKSDLNISPFRYGVQARLGYGNIRIFANYQLNPLFEKDNGPELYPFSAGLQILSF